MNQDIGANRFRFDIEQSGPVFGLNFKWGARTQ